MTQAILTEIFWFHSIIPGEYWVEVKRKAVPRHEDVWGSGGIAPPFLTSELVDVNGQLHASAALPPGKESPVPLR
jgi:hypothetical protein